MATSDGIVDTMAELDRKYDHVKRYEMIFDKILQSGRGRANEGGLD